MDDKIQGSYIMPFGKYTGKPINEIPAAYLLHLNSFDWFRGRAKMYVEQNIEQLKQQSESESDGNPTNR